MDEETSHQRRARGLDAERAQYRADVVGGYAKRIKLAAPGRPGARKVDTVGLQRERGPGLARALLHQVAALDACAVGRPAWVLNDCSTLYILHYI